MSTHRWPAHHRARALGIGLLILSLAHTPWPQADFHNVRHHDEPGQVCEHHDHLLRWHPDAGLAADVAVLHWHWVPPLSDSSESGHSGDRPAIHAFADDWSATAPDLSPAIVPDGASRPVSPPIPCPMAFDLALVAHPVDVARPGFAARSPLTFGASIAPGAPLAAWLQRWSC